MQSPVGSSSWLGSWWAGSGYKEAILDALQVPCKLTTKFQHGSAPFKVANMFSWMVVIGSHEHVEEFRKAPEDVLSCSESINGASYSLVSQSDLR